MSFRTFTAIDPEWCGMTSLKHHLLKKYAGTNSSKTMMREIKFILRLDTKSFAGYAVVLLATEKTWGGRLCPSRFFNRRISNLPGADWIFVLLSASKWIILPRINLYVQTISIVSSMNDGARGSRNVDKWSPKLYLPRMLLSWVCWQNMETKYHGGVMSADNEAWQ